tara:strand:- start:368 stop:556 length:189 start_codon:yes stop_codon:yes gene_type:complete
MKKKKKKSPDPIDGLLFHISGFGDKQLYNDELKMTDIDKDGKNTFPKEMIEEHLNRVNNKNS